MPGRSQHSWFGHGAAPWTGASESLDPNRAGTEPWSSRGGERHRGAESVGHQAGWGLPQDLRQRLECQDLSGRTGLISCLAERPLLEPGAHRGPGVSAGLGRYEADSVVLAATQGTTGSGTGDTVGTGDMAGTVSRVESGCRAAVAAAAAAGRAGSVPKV